MDYDKVTLFTPASILGLLLQLDELSGCDIGIDEDTETGKVILYIDDNIYSLDPLQETEVQVDDEIMDKVEESVEDGYDFVEDGKFEQDVEETSETEDFLSYFNHLQPLSVEEYFGFSPEPAQEKVEGGILKNAAKALMLGGMIRFANKHLLK